MVSLGVGIDTHLTLSDPNVTRADVGWLGVRSGLSVWAAKDKRVFAMYLTWLAAKDSADQVLRNDMASKYWGRGYLKGY